MELRKKGMGNAFSLEIVAMSPMVYVLAPKGLTTANSRIMQTMRTIRDGGIFLHIFIGIFPNLSMITADITAYIMTRVRVVSVTYCPLSSLNDPSWPFAMMRPNPLQKPIFTVDGIKLFKCPTLKIH